jgi:hypothetical protein
MNYEFFSNLIRAFLLLLLLLLLLFEILILHCAGFTNGNTSLLKAAISDLTTGPTRALAFAYHGATYQLSRALAKYKQSIIRLNVSVVVFFLCYEAK